MVSDQTLEGLGTTSSFLLQTLFGSIMRLAAPEQQLYPPSPPGRLPSPGPSVPPLSSPEPTAISSADVNGVQPTTMVDRIASLPLADEPTVIDEFDNSASPSTTLVQDLDQERPSRKSTRRTFKEKRAMAKPTLTDLLPEPGYFLAGAVSGAVSRTATAPLDRLKVALLVQTQTKAALEPGHKTARPIREAIMTLWRAGGIKTFFAGKRFPLSTDRYLAVTRSSFGRWPAVGRSSDSRLLTILEGNGLNVIKIMPESAIRVSRCTLPFIPWCFPVC